MPIITYDINMPAPYFAPSFFAPSYFGGSMPSGSSDLLSTPPTDRQQFDALVQLLITTRAFDDVVFGAHLPASIRRPLAWVQPWKFRETGLADDGDKLRRVTYKLNLITESSSADPSEPFDRLDQLARFAQSAIEGQPLAGCYAAETLLAEGTYPEPRAVANRQIGPDWWLTLIGTFEYDVPGYTRDLSR